METPSPSLSPSISHMLYPLLILAYLTSPQIVYLIISPTKLIHTYFSVCFSIIYTGAGIFSSGAGNYDGGGSNSQSSETGLGDIPEGCISYLLMSFDPQEICQLARVNKAFHRASSRDFVWESKLPQAYKFLLNKVLGEESLGTMTKKEIYAKLCQPNFFHCGTKEIWLDRCSEFVCSFHENPSR